MWGSSTGGKTLPHTPFIMTEHKKRAEKRAEQSDPINFTCGLCRRVHPFDAESPYGCPDEKEEAAPEEN